MIAIAVQVLIVLDVFFVLSQFQYQYWAKVVPSKNNSVQVG